MREELKSCPCCGSTDLLIKEYPVQKNEVFTYFSKRYAVLCVYTGDEKGCGLESGHFKSENEAVLYWNTRPEPAKEVCPVDDVREAFENTCRIDQKILEYDSKRNTYDYLKLHIVSKSDEIYKQYVVMQWIGFENGYNRFSVELDVWKRRWEADQKRMEKANQLIDRLKAEHEAMRCCGNCGTPGLSKCFSCRRKISGRANGDDNWQPKENN